MMVGKLRLLVRNCAVSCPRQRVADPCKRGPPLQCRRLYVHDGFWFFFFLPQAAVLANEDLDKYYKALDSYVARNVAQGWGSGRQRVRYSNSVLRTHAGRSCSTTA
jgi:hypothetical protein